MVLSWLNYQARRIPQRPRAVKISDRIRNLRLSSPLIYEIERALKVGGDLSPWLSDSVRRRKRDHRADLMFNDWQIVHFHLGRIFASASKAKRSSDLLFAFVAADQAILLDVMPHGSWTDTSILKTLLRTCPSTLESFEIKGVTGLDKNPSKEERQQLRKGGTTVLIEVEGKTFLSPGHGIVTSCHALRQVHFYDAFRECHEMLINGIQDNHPEWIRPLSRAGFSPIRLGLRYSAGQLIFFDKGRGMDLVHMRPLE